MKKKNKRKNNIVLSQEQLEILKKRNEEQRKRNEFVIKRKNEIGFSGIQADYKDIIAIKRLQFWVDTLNFVGNLFQGIINIFNRKFIKEKNDFWYRNIYTKYNVPKELALTWVKIEKGKYKFVIPEENDK